MLWYLKFHRLVVSCLIFYRFLTNFQNHYSLPLANIKEAQINDKDFKIVENAYGTVFYTGKYFYFPDYQKLNNVLYDYYNPLFLPKETILKVIREE